MQISLLGCGWLGLPLAKALLANAMTVKASTTTASKLPAMNGLGIEPYLIDLDRKFDHVEAQNIAAFLQESDCLIICIPPKLRGKQLYGVPTDQKVFVEKIKRLIPFIEQAKLENILFVSSTSVYGQINQHITEETPPLPDTESGKQLLEVERLLQENHKFKTSLIRFGGLIGQDRHPVHFLAGKQNLENPNSPINLIDQLDCIGIIIKIIQKNAWGQIFNAVAPLHPSRENYYTQKARELHLDLPKFDYSKPSINKIIESHKVENLLNYSFVNKNF